MLDQYPETLINVEWHSAGYTPGDSDFEECYYYDAYGACYGARASLYGVGGIPHTQWNGIEETVGGYGGANWEALIGTFQELYGSMVGDETPFEINISGLFEEGQVSYDVTVSLDAYMSSSDMKVEIIVVEDNIYSYWGAVNEYHNARNVGRHWLATEDLTITNSGESQTFSGTFDVDLEAWNPDSIKMIVLAQSYDTYQVFQAAQVNINNFDMDEDGVSNDADNCMEIFNPEQEDIDSDGLGDVCDICDNENVFVNGNIDGNVSIDGSVIIDIADILTLVEVVEENDPESCGYQAGDMTTEGDVNIIDIIALAQLIISGAFDS